MLKVVIVGYGEMFTNLIAGALDANCEIVGVFRKARIENSSFVNFLLDTFNPTIEYNYIKSYNIPEIKAKSVNSEKFRKELIKLNPDIVLVGSWGEKFEKATYDIPKIATINAHPSLLPKYRGPNPYYWVIRNQETVTGVTFHLMDDRFDNGAILAQEEIKIFHSDTGKSLKERTVLTARGVVCELLNALKEDIIIPLQQIEEKSSYYSYPEILELKFDKSSEEISAQIRASYPWSKTYFYHDITLLTPNPQKLLIAENKTEYTQAGTIVEMDVKTKTLGILCGDNKVLKMSDVSLYKKCDTPFTRNYFSQEIKIGEICF